MSLLEVRNVTKKFGGFTAISDVSLSVEPREAYAIIGPNGAGKTTLFNLISGLLPPDKGEIEFNGARLRRMKPHEIVRMGMARSFQKVNVFPRMTSLENVQVALIVHNGAAYNPVRGAASAFRDEAMELLTLVRLGEDTDRRAGELAHGKQKQLELALTLAARPKILLLDEPTAGMSLSETRACVALIAEIVEAQGLTLVFTEHDMDVVFELATTIAVLHHGEIIASGAPLEVRENAEVRRVYLGQD